MKSASKNLTVGNPLKLLVAYALPSMVGMLFGQLYSMVDAVVAGRFLGSQALAAVGATGSMHFMILNLVTGSCTGFSILISQAFGAGEHEEVRNLTGTIIYLCVFLSLVMGVLSSALTPAILRLLNTPEDIMSRSVSYIRTIFMGFPVIVLTSMCCSMFNALGNTKIPVIINTCCTVVNMVLDVLFILVLKLDVFGTALATVICNGLSGAAALIMLRKKMPILHLEKKHMQFRPQEAKKLLAIGLPYGLQYSITGIGSLLVTAAANGLGTLYVAAMAASSKVYGFLTCVFDALAGAVSTFTAQNIGAKRMDRVKQGVRSGAIIGGIYSVFAFLLVFFFSKQLIGIFISQSEQDVINLGSYYMIRVVAFFIPLMFVNIMRLSIQGMGFTKVAMLSGAMEMVGRAFVALVLVPRFGFDALCFANPTAWILADCFLIPCFFSTLRKVSMKMRPAGMNID